MGGYEVGDYEFGWLGGWVGVDWGGWGPAQNAHSGIKRNDFLTLLFAMIFSNMPLYQSSRGIRACCISSSQVMLISHLSKSNKDMYCIEILYKYDHRPPSKEGKTCRQ